jgi:hypothetical protein
MIINEETINEFKPDQDFFEDLKKGKFVLVLGAGFSHGIKNCIKDNDLPKAFNIPYEKYKNIPISKDFNTLTNLLFSEEEDIDKYQAAANLWEDSNFNIKGTDLSVFFRNLFKPDRDDFISTKQKLYRYILSPSWHGIYTFNFDTVIETIVEFENRISDFYSKWFPDHKGILAKKKETYIAHLHGIITNDNLNDLVFSENGYKRLRRELHTLYDTLHNDAHENLKLFIVGTQFDEESIDDKFFDSLKNDVTIYHFDRKNNDFRTKPNIRNNPNYHFIKIKEINEVLEFLKSYQNQIENHNFTQYLNRIIENENISKVDSLYVNLFGQEDISALQTDSIGIELLSEEFATSYSLFTNYQNKDVKISFSSISNESKEVLEINNEEDDFDIRNEVKSAQRQPKVDSILNLEREIQRFIIVGAPGSGKTFSLKKILFQNANKIINDKSDIKIPILIPANEYKSDRNFKLIISNILHIDDCESLLNEGKVQLLIDGINEIDLNQKRKSYKELTSLINEYPGIAVIITTRKTGFINEFNIPVFELKELQESEIKDFIQKRNPEKLESLWSQLEGNRKLLELAYNPLYLSMIVIASKEGIIPNNRGALFDSFVHALLLREKLSQLDITSIIDILSEFAFYLKKEGMVSVPKEKAEKIIIERIKSTHDFHSPFDLLAKVKVCNLVSITSNTSFIHEAFLDYFSAVKIKINFNEQFNSETIRIDNIGISIEDITEPIWYEPLIMCGDLFKEQEEEKQAFDYFNLLYKGSLQKSPQVKRINELSKEDWNENLKIPCKVAYNLKGNFPSIYCTAERYLSNYMTLWLINYKKSIEIIPLSKIFEGVASLSSNILLERILFNDDWQEVWLFNPNDKSTEFNQSNNNSVLYIETNNLSDSIVKNISDFDTLCKLIFDEDKLNSCVFPVITGRIGEIGHSLLRNTSIVNLKNAYLNKIQDLDLLKFISYIDPIFFISHYNKDAWGISEYINQLLEIIRFNDARIELINIISLLDESQQVLIIISFLNNKFYTSILEYLNNRIDSLVLSESNFELIKSSLKLVPLNTIPLKLRNHFFLKYDLFSADYEIVEYIKNSNVIRVQLNNVLNLKKFKNHTEGILNNTVLCKLENLRVDYLTLIDKENTNFIKYNKENAQLLNNENNSLHLCVKLKNIDDTSKLSEIGTISEFNTKIGICLSAEYKLARVTRQLIDLEIKNCTNINDIFCIQNNVIINQQIEGVAYKKFIVTKNSNLLGWKSIDYFNIDESDLEKYRILMIIKLPNEVNIEEINKIGFIKVQISWQYLIAEIHPDDYKNKNFILNEHLYYFEPNKKEQKEISRLGIVNKFHKIFLNVNYGIIISIYNLSVQLLSILNKSIIDIKVSEEEIGFYSINQIVVIEKYNRIGIISDEDQTIEKIGYITDEIIRIDYEKREGHIKKSLKADLDEKDFYFHFNDCNFYPHLGDIVSFIPAINIFPSSFGLPKAYRISKIKNVSYCKITNINYNGNTLDLYGTAIDEEKNQELSFLIRNKNKILNNNPKSGDKFSYLIKSYSSENGNPFIKLLEKIK